ncbi:DNA polymerase III subunit epsilon [Acinetobacter sp. P1(2023)]|uniref:DNA polymerase III subunit epsilon n=1 Tax=unclassified Acinetobacter TaxID=196816 RepID=UPI0021CD6896|nr:MULTISPECIES: DNA polymerase III subunit epsilon [unclassified Acinetobacter]MCU4528963.1 DNA polymerase III subunit epsilon [Acinetobacter sp. WU_MDCI_Abxe169]MDC0841048.1 DNA polymerase III subunit epsilon [Acinetobacter sp. P1(2023)]
MSQTITLYVDGACRGNPGLGGWGAYVITEQGEHKLFGGEPDTTNNRMELTAAIEGVSFCPADAHLIIWTDSNYVKQGITEWIHGWKKKNWKDVKNPDLWQKLDAVCAGRNIEWNWIKGHAGHPGNEMADQLANLGADKTAKELKQPQPATVPQDIKKPEQDWLLDDPFGFDLAEVTEEENIHLEATEEVEMIIEDEEVIEVETAEQESKQLTKNIHPQIVVTEAKLKLQGPRQLILDTETTGFYFQDGDRIIEVGAIEMINRKLTGSSIHIYINPQKPVGDSENVHGISDDFLKDKPLYADIADTLFDYLKGAEIIAHNATFDMNFLDMEFKRAGLPALSEVCEVTDTLALAKNKHPGQKNSLDALVRRYEIPARDRTFHGALLDAEILADVYLAMTGGQVSFDIDALSQSENSQQTTNRSRVQIDLPVIYPSEEELNTHETWVKEYEEKHGEPCLFAK